MIDTTIPANFVASGKVTAVKDGFVIFNPSGTSYELQLAAPTYSGPLNKPIRCMIYATARKVYTVPSGGNFIVPIFGSPRIVQGLVRSADENSIVVQAGCPIHIKLPAADHAIDLTNGPVTVGRMVNVVCMPGTRIELIA
jgi:hypothetical protein